MIKLIINNSESQISGLSLLQLQQVRDAFSYSTDEFHYYTKSFHNSKKYLIDNTGRFPTGLVYRVEPFLSRFGTFSIDDQRKSPKVSARIGLKGTFEYQPYPEQEEIVKVAIKAARGTICAPTGFGKSITMALLVNSLKLRTLIIVPNLELKRQLTESFTAFFGKEAMKAYIKIENIDSKSLFKHTDYDCLIVDESHHVAAKTYRTLNKKSWKGIYYRFFFTATPFRSKDEEQMLFEGLADQVIYRVDYRTCVEKGYIVPLDAYYVELPRTAVKGRTWAQVYSELVVNNDTRNQIIKNLLLRLSIQDGRTLCLVKEIKHGEILQYDGAFPFIHGQSEDRELIQRFADGSLMTLISTTGIMGEGVDSKACEYVVIAGLGRSKNSFMQSCGRAFRRFPGKESGKIIIFLDRSHKWMLAHFKAQVKYLKEEYGVDVIKLSI